MRFRIDEGAAGLLVQSFGPGDLRERLAGDELAGDAVDHVVEPVLVGLHQHLALLAPDGHVGQQQLLDAVVIPGIAGHHLEIPFQLAGIGLHGENRSQVEILLALGLAQLFGPGAAVAGADVEQIGVGIVGHAVPDRAAAAELPIVARPGFRGFLQRGILEGLRRIAGNGVKLPGELAGLGVEGGEESADGKFRAGDADDHFPFGDARRHGHRVAFVRIGHARFPDRLAGFGIERDQASIDDGRDDQVLIHREAAIHHAAADLAGGSYPDSLPDPSATFPCRCARRRRRRCSSW